MLFDKLSVTNIELSTARIEFQETNSNLKQELTATRNELSATKHELSTTKIDLAVIRNEFEAKNTTVKKELTITRNELQETKRKFLKLLKEDVNTCATISREVASATAATTVITPSNCSMTINSLLREVSDPRGGTQRLLNSKDQTQTTRLYQKNVNRLFGLMKNGQFYYLNEDECFFKLHLRRNSQAFYIYLAEDLQRFRTDPENVFTNENIVLKDSSCDVIRFLSTCYYLFVSIRNFKCEDSKCFLVDTKQSENNLLMKYGLHGNENIEWNEYNDVKGCVIFYFTKQK